MKFICTSKGFLVGRSVTRDENGRPNGMETLYTPHVREAKVFTKYSAAIKFMEKNNIEGFIYSPYSEEVHKDGALYDVCTVNKFEWGDTQETSDIQDKVYKPVKQWTQKYTDIDFLNKIERPENKFLTEEQARQKSTRLNNLLIEELKKQNEINNSRRFN